MKESTIVALSIIIGGIIFSLICMIIIFGVGGYKTDNTISTAIIVAHIGFALTGMMVGYMIGYGIYEVDKFEEIRKQEETYY
jgi:multisubunit Na+/H+ antiporter MnhG subunit